MYTDGLVETVDRDIGSGIDKLAGRGSCCSRPATTGGAQMLIDALEHNDDGALVLVHRR